MKYFKSKYSGYCWYCQSKFDKGTLISWDSEKRKAKHKECPRRNVTKPSRRRARFVTGR